MLAKHKGQLLRWIATRPDGCEIEARFGRVVDGRFRNEISFAFFDRLRTQLLQTMGNVSPDIYRDTIHREYRKTVRSDGTETITRKTQVPGFNIYDLDYGIRLSASVESNVSGSVTLDPMTIIRDKKRWSFPISGSRIDITVVDQTDLESGLSTNRYEVEVELLDTNRLDDFFAVIENVYRDLHGTEIAYTIQERNDIIRYTNRLLGSSNNNASIDMSRIRQARNLRWADLVEGGLVGNPTTEYVVYHKPDGVRKLIVISTSAIWILYPPNDFNLLIRDPSKIIQGSILYSEEIPQDRRRLDAPKSKYWELVYDCVATDNQPDLGNELFINRMRRGQDIADILKDTIPTNLAWFETMKYRALRQPEDLYTVSTEMLQENDYLPYEQDGLIFFAMGAGMQDNTDKLPLDQRVLTAHADVCKWKPQELLTNDLSLRWVIQDNGSRILDLDTVDKIETELYINGKPAQVNHVGTDNLSYAPEQVYVFRYSLRDNLFTMIGTSTRDPDDSYTVRRLLTGIGKDAHMQSKTIFNLRIRYKNKKPGLYVIDQDYVPFRGTDRYPFDPSSIQVTDLVAELPTRAVVEWQLRQGTYVPLRVRNDKYLPNRKEIAIDNWTLAHNPISANTIKGLTFNLFYRYLEDKTIGIIQQLGSYSNVIVVGNAAFLLDVFPDIRIVDELPINIERDSIFIFYRALDSVPEGIAKYNNLAIGTRVINIGLDTAAIDNFFRPEIQGPVVEYSQMGPHRVGYLPNDPEYPNSYGKCQIVIDDTVYYPFGATEFALSGYEVLTSESLDNNPMFTAAEKLFASLHALLILVKTEQVADPAKSASKIEIPITAETQEEIMQTGQVKTIGRAVGNRLPMLPVITPANDSKGYKTGQVAIGDDATEPLKTSWYKNLVRIATIGDGSCFFHAVLKASSADYQENNEAVYRIQLVEKLRRDAAMTLEMPDELEPNKTKYETANDGQFVVLAKEMAAIKREQEKKREEEKSKRKREEEKSKRKMADYSDYTLAGLQSLFNSKQDVGDETYQYLSDLLGIDVYVMSADTLDMVPHLNTSKAFQPRNGVVIVGNRTHYEVVAVDYGDLGLQTLFEPDHDFLKAIRSLSSDEGGYKTGQTRLPHQEMIQKLLSTTSIANQGRATRILNALAAKPHSDRIFQHLAVYADAKIRGLSLMDSMLTDLSEFTRRYRSDAPDDVLFAEYYAWVRPFLIELSREQNLSNQDVKIVERNLEKWASQINAKYSEPIINQLLFTIVNNSYTPDSHLSLLEETDTLDEYLRRFDSDRKDAGLPISRRVQDFLDYIDPPPAKSLKDEIGALGLDDKKKEILLDVVRMDLAADPQRADLMPVIRYVQLNPDVLGDVDNAESLVSLVHTLL